MYFRVFLIPASVFPLLGWISLSLSRLIILIVLFSASTYWARIQHSETDLQFTARKWAYVVPYGELDSLHVQSIHSFIVIY
jgi:hypothetical protein